MNSGQFVIFSCVGPDSHWPSRMELSSSTSASGSTPAISIPLHGNGTVSAHRSSQQSTRRRAAQARRALQAEQVDSETSSSLGSDWGTSPASAPRVTDRHQVPIASPPDASTHSTTPPQRNQRKDKQRADFNDLPPTQSIPPLFVPSQSPLGPSMLSSSAYKSVNLNSHHDPDSREPPRLITYTKHSQGFTWNDELFLPSYLLGRHRYRGHAGSAMRRRWAGDGDDDDIGDFEEEGERCPVTDIFVTDEEAAAMMP